MNSPNPNSKRSKKRKNRNFVDLLTSSRIHRKAEKRSLISRTHYGRTGNPGDLMSGGGDTFIHKAGGSYKYH